LRDDNLPGKSAHRAIRAIAVCMILLGVALSAPAGAADQPVIAAASSLNGALEEIRRTFTQATGSKIRISFGSSGNLTRQIVQGAPFELFLSADEAYTAALVDKGLTAGASHVYAVGRLVLFIPAGSGLNADSTFEDLTRALSDGRLRRLALANPEHAPCGRAAREVLEYHQLWQGVQG